MKALILPATLFLMAGHQQKTTSNILISSKNNIFYYQDTLATDGSNFKAIHHRHMKDWSNYLEKTFSEVYYVLKVEEKDSLNSFSQNLISYYKGKKHFKIDTLSIDEKTLVQATEAAWLKSQDFRKQ